MPQTSNKDKSKDPEPDTHGHRPAVVSVPRTWLAVLTALVIVPWIGLSAWYFWDDSTSELTTPTGENAPADLATPGPWGRLLSTPIVISPPLEYVSTEWGPPGPPVWDFPHLNADQVQALLVRAGMPAEAAARVRATARPVPQIKGVEVQPDPAVIEALSPDVRGRLYQQLASMRGTYAQLHPFRFEGPSFDTWFRGSLTSGETRALIEPLIYRDGDFMFFADLALVRPRITDEEELRRLIKTLYRQPTLLVKLSVPASSVVEGLSAYWGRGGRRTDLRPLLESIAGTGDQHAVDITHLLPSFARNLLYRYPQISAADLSRPIIANCLWTALNFFNSEPDDRFLEVPYALEHLRTDYHIIQHGLELGDLVAFVDPEGDLFHIAVYIADDLVFTKNGTTPMAPWTLMSITSLTGYYRALVPEPRLIYHRSNTL